MIPLEVLSYYSLMRGTCSPERLCMYAKKLGYRRLALTDIDNLYGMWPFLSACKKAGIAPIVGAKVTNPLSGPGSDQDSGLDAVCLVENGHGFRNLCRLITRRHQDRTFDLKSALPDHAEGLVVLTRSFELLSHFREKGVTAYAAAPCKPDSSSFKLRKKAARIGAPMVAVPASVFAKPDDFNIHRILRAIDLNTSVFRLTGQDTALPGAWLASPLEYKQRFAIWPDTIKATYAISERLTFTGPDFGLVMPPWADETKCTAEQKLRDLAFIGARARYGDDLSESVVDRLEHELKTIENMGFSSYFLVVKDIVLRSPRICGRGSGAASLVAYCLGITNVCPVKHNLYFARFLNPGRNDPPDIDVDFAWDEREDVLFSVLKQYRGRAAMVCNHVTFKPRMAIRETAKVFGLTELEIKRVTKRMPWFWENDFTDNDLLTHLKRLPEMGEFDFPAPWPKIIDIARRIIGAPRHISVHPGGVVITPGPIEDFVPIELAPKGVPIIQWEKNGAEESGLVKIDLLGNRSLGVIRDTILNLADNKIPFDERIWEPEADPATQKNVAKGDTMGCFYIESPATRLLQKKTGKGDFEHLIIHSSIIRPAANEFIREYIRRLKGGGWKPLHPLLGDVLDETYGIMVYQEDVSKTAVALAGFSHADADGLRKTMSKKDKTRRLHDYKHRFTSGALARGINHKQIEAIWNMMMSFSGYSFCKPHSASYARVSFQAAYLKTHYPAEFMAAVISNQGGFYSTFAYVSEARRMGVKILPPDVNKSHIRWKGKNMTMRVGLITVKHLSAATRDRIISQRKAGPFRSITDFLERVLPDDTESRSLIHAGGFNSLYPDENPAPLLWELSCRQKSRHLRSKEQKLFETDRDIPTPPFPAENIYQRLRLEFTALGFLCHCHPMVLFENALKKQNVTKAKDLPGFVGKHVRIAGLLITAKKVHTKKGKPMEFITFEDETGLVETTFFPKAYSRFCAMLDKNRPFVLSGKVEQEFGAATMNVVHAGYL